MENNRLKTLKNSVGLEQESEFEIRSDITEKVNKNIERKLE